MRETKFRGFDILKKIWVYGYLFKSWNTCYILWGTINGIPTTTEVIPETVGQYIGLQDKNGTEIYEGDRLEIVTEDNTTNQFIVKYGIARREMASGWEVDIPCFYFDLTDGDFKAFPIVFNYAGKHDLEMLEVIGNIWEDK